MDGRMIQSQAKTWKVDLRMMDLRKMVLQRDVLTHIHGSENLQVTVKKPLHSQKVGIWCGVWSRDDRRVLALWCKKFRGLIITWCELAYKIVRFAAARMATLNKQPKLCKKSSNHWRFENEHVSNYGLLCVDNLSTITSITLTSSNSVL